MSRPTGRHRVRRESGRRALRRPAVVATAAISAVSVSAAGYATASGSLTSSASSVSMRTGNQQANGAALGAADAGVAADAAAQLNAQNSAVAARAAAQGKTKSLLAKQRAQAAALRTRADKSAAAKRGSVARAKSAAAAKAKAAAAAKAEAKRTRDTQTVSRGGARPPANQTRAYGGSPQAIASSMLSSYGWGQDQMGCLTSLWNKESGWNVSASNGGSGAYGIPQSLPGSKMASAGADWRTNPATQIRWGLGYIQSVYGSPCSAWGHSQATNWY
ncbi:lytic transglycosylase domain-containing protein [Leekyejoonella antrihumi]|uniref:Lytic transglycosylase domain-containing protein n=1 Tax=Leekyejoonella antrihumi TaxID=1660198 RepID=A0A563E0X7_9MICO|nr:lytic transglycosylase domain-containing protein [Leekyejoonella antrihumi]TWP36190.1 lytic transglycosylase domain-containing protein [Leekyejoonella antrihumi]